MQVLWGNVPSGSKSAQSGQGVRHRPQLPSGRLGVARAHRSRPKLRRCGQALGPLHQPVLGGWSLDTERLQLGKCRVGALPGGRGGGWCTGQHLHWHPLSSPLDVSFCRQAETTFTVLTLHLKHGGGRAAPMLLPSETAKHQCQERTVHILSPALELGVGKCPLMKKSAFGAEVKFSFPVAT